MKFFISNFVLLGVIIGGFAELSHLTPSYDYRPPSRTSSLSTSNGYSIGGGYNGGIGHNGDNGIGASGYNYNVNRASPIRQVAPTYSAPQHTVIHNVQPSYSHPSVFHSMPTITTQPTQSNGYHYPKPAKTQFSRTSPTMSGYSGRAIASVNHIPHGFNTASRMPQSYYVQAPARHPAPVQVPLSPRLVMHTQMPISVSHASPMINHYSAPQQFHAARQTYRAPTYNRQVAVLPSSSSLGTQYAANGGYIY